MTANFEIESKVGVVAFWDVRYSPNLAERRDEKFATTLKEQAKRGEIFYIQSEGEETVRYRLRVLVEEETAESIHKLYDDTGGSFRMDVPSGELVLCGLGEDAMNSNVQPAMQIAPGDYLLNAMTLRTFDLAEFKRRRTELLGPSDADYARKVDNVGMYGCLATLLLGVSLLIPYTRRYWAVTIPVLLAPWLFHMVLRVLPRYRRIQKKDDEFNKQLSHFIIRLKRSASAQELSGGWIRGM